jgi:hypothetical protein
MSPPSFPQAFPCPGAPFPPRGPSSWFPRFLGTVKHSDFLPPLPRCFVAFAARYRHASWVSFPQLQDATAAGLELFTGIPKPDSLTETTGPPRFLEDPTVNVPCSSTPVGPLRSATATLRCCLPPHLTTSTPTISNISRLNHTARSLAVYASQGGLPHRHARLASGWLASLVRAELDTRWVPMKGFRSFHSPFPGFAWRTKCPCKK